MRSFLLIIIYSSFAVSAVKAQYDKKFFRYPLDIPQKLNANFGEMRPNHFHMGLDLYTNSRENLPVLAAADGYIAKVKIEAGGFGNAVYINHPNGLTTLYAHLNDLMPELAAYVKEQQYKAESWKIELEIPAKRFPVKKGQFIAYSGNTGGSQGPHVHFEVRETATDKCLNPQLFDFGVPDHTAPDIYKIAIYDANKSIYEQTPKIFPVKKLSAGKYALAAVIKVSTDKILVALQATDRNDLSFNANGFYEATLYKNNEAMCGFVLNRISYDETRLENAHIDYRTKFNGGSYLQLLNQLPGNTSDIYKELPGKYAVSINDYDEKKCRLEVKDADGNISELEFTVQSDDLSPAVINSSANRVVPNIVNVKEGPGWQLYFPDNCFYDEFDLKVSAVASAAPNAFSAVFNFNTPAVPVQDTFYVRIKPSKAVPESLKDKLIIQKIVKQKKDVQKAVWVRDYLQGEFREFGTYTLLADDVPPQILAYGIKNGGSVTALKKIVISVKDNYEEIKNFRAELDGKWLMFSQRGNTFTYRMDERFAPGRHQLKISVQDEAGNSSVSLFELIR